MTKKQRTQNAICSRLALGESLRTICADEKMPDKSTVFAWLQDDPVFQQAYAIARRFQAESFADDIIEIADDATGDWMTIERNGESERVIDREHVDRSKLRVDARKWLASRLAPKKYGEATLIRHADADGNRVGGETESALLRLASLVATITERKE